MAYVRNKTSDVRIATTTSLTPYPCLSRFPKPLPVFYPDVLSGWALILPTTIKQLSALPNSFSEQGV